MALLNLKAYVGEIRAQKIKERELHKNAKSAAKIMSKIADMRELKYISNPIPIAERFYPHCSTQLQTLLLDKKGFGTKLDFKRGSTWKYDYKIVRYEDPDFYDTLAEEFELTPVHMEELKNLLKEGRWWQKLKPFFCQK